MMNVFDGQKVAIKSTISSFCCINFSEKTESGPHVRFFYCITAPVLKSEALQMNARKTPSYE